MKEYNFYQDVKVTCWVRQKFTIEAESESEAKKIAEKYKSEDISESDDSDLILDTEWLVGTCEPLSVEENGGCSTIELYNSKKELIGQNAEI